MKSTALKKNMPASEDSPATPKGGSRPRRRVQSSGKTMIGGMYDWEVRRALSMINLEPENQGRTLTDLLGEAINDLCVKYGHKPPYRPEDEEE